MTFVSSILIGFLSWPYSSLFLLSSLSSADRESLLRPSVADSKNRTQEPQAGGEGTVGSQWRRESLELGRQWRRPGTLSWLRLCKAEQECQTEVSGGATWRQCLQPWGTGTWGWCQGWCRKQHFLSLMFGQEQLQQGCILEAVKKKGFEEGFNLEFYCLLCNFEQVA